MKKVLAVIVSYNVGKEFENNIEILLGKVDKIVVVDNGSKKETINMLHSLGEKIELLSLKENMGIAYALNRGIEYGINNGYEWVLTLDHDSIVEENMIKNMLSTYEGIDEATRKNIGMITPVHIEEKENKSSEVNEENKGWKYVLTEITSGSMVKSSFYKKYGLYDEDLFIDLVDHDYCLKINKLGYKIIQVNSAVLLHNLGESLEKNIVGIKMIPTNHSALRRYYMTRNRLYIWEKYKSDFRGWVLLDQRRFITEIIKILVFEDKKIEKMKMILLGIKDYRRSILGSYFKSHK